MLSHVLWAAVLFLTTTVLGKDIILKPTIHGKFEVCLVFIQGAEITPEQYIPLAQNIQNTSNYSLWIGIPDFTFNFPEPIEISGEVERILKSLKSAGMNTTDVVFAAHSLGGVMLQDYLFDNPKMGFAQVLMGSYLLRKYRNQSYPIPTLTIGAELDGLCRITRIMEAFYHKIYTSSNVTEAIGSFPVTIIEGMSHMQFASGNPPILVKDKDLRPEISYKQAHQEVAALVSAFISLHLGQQSSFTTLSQSVENAGVFMKPILDAFLVEGYHNFKPPCNSNPPSPLCTVGSQWSEHAQIIMGGDALENIHILDSDAFHPVDQIDPVHLPHIDNNCSAPNNACVLHTSTVTQNVYDELDKFDTGTVPISASEMRVKMSSRQAMMEAAGYKNVNFNSSDGSSLCKVINQNSYDWALNSSSLTTKSRFQKYGVPYIMGEDEGPYNIGPLWIWDPLKYEKISNSSGGTVAVEIRSPMLRTPLDFFIKVSAGFHYCKLLSPARAMEWVYVDGLRDHYGIK